MLKSINTKVRNAAVLLASAGVTGLALATPTDPFDTAMTNATTKVSGYAAALVGLAAVSVVFMIGVKYVKKIRGAA